RCCPLLSLIHKTHRPAGKFARGRSFLKKRALWNLHSARSALLSNSLRSSYEDALQTQGLLDLADDQLSNVAGSVGGLGAQVRSDDEVVALEQGGVEGSTLGQAAGSQLVLHNVGGIAADLAGLQSLIHILLVDDAAAGHV